MYKRQKIAFATFLCVISPIPLIGFTTLCQYQRFYMAENLAISIGLSFLIICITIAVILFCLCAFKVKKYDFLEKEDFSLENSVKEYAAVSYTHLWIDIFINCMNINN